MELFKHISDIYNHLQDEESREIFIRRSLFSLTDNIMDFIEKNPAWQYLENASNENAYIFGCGFHGRRIQKMLNKDWKGYTDNNESLWGECIDGVKVIPPQKLPKNSTVYLAVKYYQKEIKDQLLAQGIRGENIVNVGELLIEFSNRQYFDRDFLPHAKDEIFVDVGSLDGETSRNFIKWSKDRYKHIYCFEADPHNAEDCEHKMKDLLDSGKMTLVAKAVSDKIGATSFIMRQDETSQIGVGDMQIETVSLDSILLDKNPTFIKMDIEGGEYQALRGAKKIISELHPKLAISIYHSPRDIFDIPALILSYYPDYRFYIRHYSPYAEETVLYAI